MQANSGTAPRALSGRRRQRFRSGERQREIVATVLDLARERGPDAITTQAIADRIHVTQAALFKHFPDKEAIWLAVFAWVREALNAAFDTAVANGGPALQRLERAFVAHVAFVAANPGVPRVLFHELQYPGNSPVRVAVREMIGGYRKRILSLVREAKRAGELAPDVDVALAPVLFIGAVQGLVIHASLAGEPALMNRRARPAFRVLLDGWRG
jgi:AcrR family transcriptional regulator